MNTTTKTYIGDTGTLTVSQGPTIFGNPYTTLNDYTGTLTICTPSADAPLMEIRTPFGPIKICNNGDVSIPDGMELGDAAKAFWTAVSLVR